MNNSKSSKDAKQEHLESLLAFENKYYDMGYNVIAGVDECGRGPLAGPVAAAAVILPRNCVILGLDDSKKLSEKKRESVYAEIMEKALAVGYAEIPVEIINEINILRASLLAMSSAIEKLSVLPEIILIDGNYLPDINIKGAALEAIIKGDQKSSSIAAASIVAKVSRDRLMRIYDKEYPVYGFARNKAYGTPEHIAAIKTYGICPIHRELFVRKFIGQE